MAGKSRFSENFLSMIGQEEFCGEDMIAVSRAVLRNSYSDEEFNNDLFSIFILIDDESGDIILDGYGEFDRPSARHSLSGSPINNFAKALVSSWTTTSPCPNSGLHKHDIDYIAKHYKETFLSSLQEFKNYFGI